MVDRKLLMELSHKLRNLIVHGADHQKVINKLKEYTISGLLNLELGQPDIDLWNGPGFYYLQYNLSIAEKLYRTLVESIKKRDKTDNVEYHKGLAYHNLGIALLKQGKVEEAKKNFKLAYEQDIKHKTKEVADKGLAKKALDNLKDIDIKSVKPIKEPKKYEKIKKIIKKTKKEGKEVTKKLTLRWGPIEISIEGEDIYTNDTYGAVGDHLIQYSAQFWRMRDDGDTFKEFRSSYSLPIGASFTSNETSPAYIEPIATVGETYGVCYRVDETELPLPSIEIDASVQHPTKCLVKSDVSAFDLLDACSDERLNGTFSLGYFRIIPE